MENGVEVVLDQWDLALGQDLSLFMQEGISSSDRVLMICSDTYVAKAEAGKGGVGFERLIVTKEVIASIETKKFIPVARGNAAEPRTPNFLGPRLYADFNFEDGYHARLDEVLREIHGVPQNPKPAIGQNPFSGVVAASTETPREAGPTGRVSGGKSLLDDEWFNKHQDAAKAGASELKIKGTLSLRFGLHEPIEKSQIELLEAIDSSTISTFGWPIGVTLRNVEGFKPRPSGDGIRAEIAIKREAITDRESYDYWAARKNGDFYFLQNLFEDQRTEGKIFFNTRIIRVTESLMFLGRMAEKLGVPEETKFSARFVHDGLKGRVLSAVGNRTIFDRSRADEDVVSTEIISTVGDIAPKLDALVKQVCAPLFMMFDFAEFGDPIYTDIVRRFEKGEVS
tara:strand:- start:620 stop:1810 length:1191 start_codon:yes stop_codon:yes gene_type:complete